MFFVKCYVVQYCYQRNNGDGNWIGDDIYLCVDRIGCYWMFWMDIIFDCYVIDNW